MPDAVARTLVTNTTPLIALTAATGGLDVLRALYDRVLVPFEVAEEVRAGGAKAFGVDVFSQAAAHWLEVQPEAVAVQPFLQNSLDKGEAAVIQTALNLRLPLVCIRRSRGPSHCSFVRVALDGHGRRLAQGQSHGLRVGHADGHRTHAPARHLAERTGGEVCAFKLRRMHTTRLPRNCARVAARA